MPLLLAPAGGRMRIVKIIADEKTKKHLENLGILSGAHITLLSNSGGSLILKIMDSRLAIDKTLAAKIFVA